MKRYPADIRNRLLRALDAGLARVEATRTFGVPDRTIRRWQQQQRRETGSVAPKPRLASGNVMISRRVPAVAASASACPPVYHWSTKVSSTVCPVACTVSANAATCARSAPSDAGPIRRRRPPRGFVLLPRRWVVERSFAWVARFRRLTRDYERLPDTVVGLHFLAFACVLLHRLIPLRAERP